MYRSIAYSLALLMCCATVPASEPRSDDSAQHQAIYSQRMAGLAPSLRQWVVEEGRRRVDSRPDVEDVGEAVRARLSGQDFTDADVDTLVQLVLMEVAKDEDADLRAAMEDMKAANERKKAQRDAARAARQAQQQQDSALRGSSQQRTQLQSSATATTSSALNALRITGPLQARVDQIQIEKDSLSELSEADQLKMQMLMDRRAKAYAALANAMKKYSETASTIVSNLK